MNHEIQKISKQITQAIEKEFADIITVKHIFTYDNIYYDWEYGQAFELFFRDEYLILCDAQLNDNMLYYANPEEFSIENILAIMRKSLKLKKEEWDAFDAKVQTDLEFIKTLPKGETNDADGLP